MDSFQRYQCSYDGRKTEELKQSLSCLILKICKYLTLIVDSVWQFCSWSCTTHSRCSCSQGFGRFGSLFTRCQVQKFETSPEFLDDVTGLTENYLSAKLCLCFLLVFLDFFCEERWKSSRMGTQEQKKSLTFLTCSAHPKVRYPLQIVSLNRLVDKSLRLAVVGPMESIGSVMFGNSSRWVSLWMILARLLAV